MEIVIGDRKITVDDGSNITISGGTVSVGGSKVASYGEEKVELIGGVNNLSSDRSITVKGNVIGDVHAGGSVSCNDVGGSIKTSGSVSCEQVEGNVNAGGSVNCDEVRGDVNAGGSVRC